MATYIINAHTHSHTNSHRSVSRDIYGEVGRKLRINKQNYMLRQSIIGITKRMFLRFNLSCEREAVLICSSIEFQILFP